MDEEKSEDLSLVDKEEEEESKEEGTSPSLLPEGRKVEDQEEYELDLWEGQFSLSEAKQEKEKKRMFLFINWTVRLMSGRKISEFMG